MISLCRLIVCVATLLHTYVATDYYVSSSHGLDSNTGTSPTSPWKTFKNIPSLTLTAGDRLLLFCGDTWYEQLAINNARGNEGAPITVASYSPQPSTIHRPIINATGTPYQSEAVILCTNCARITFHSLEITGAQNGISFILTIQDQTVSDLNISNCYFHHINGVNITDNSGSGWGSAIITGTNSTNSRISIENLVIEHNMLHHSDTFNRIYGGVYPATIASGRIYGNTMSSNYYNVMFLGDHMYNFTIQRNVFLHDTPNQEFVAGTTDLIVGTVDSSCAIIDNEFGWRGEYDGAPDGCSIDFETHAVGTRVAGNYIHDSYGAGIMVFGHADTSQFNYELMIEENVFIRDGCYQTHNDHGAIAFMNPSSGVVQNNFFVKCANNQSVPIFWDNNNPSHVSNWTFSNNTIVNYANGSVVGDPVMSTRFDAQSASVVVTAKCSELTPSCTLRYTVDATKPNTESMEYRQGQEIVVQVTTAVLFKGFYNGLVESSTVGQIVDPSTYG